MYGPPPNCKRLEVRRRSIRVNVSGLLVENYSPGTPPRPRRSSAGNPGAHCSQGNPTDNDVARSWIAVRSWRLYLNLREEEVEGEIMCAGLRRSQTVTHKLSAFENGVYRSRKLLSIGLQQVSGSKAECVLHDFGSWLLTQEQNL
jgi:hypothetical protein